MVAKLRTNKKHIVFGSLLILFALFVSRIAFADNFVVKGIASLCVAFGDGIYDAVCGPADLDIDTLISGEGKHSDWFRFNLQSGNVYGTLGGMVYGIFLSLVLLTLVVVFFYMLLRVAREQRASKIAALKENIGQYFVVVVILLVAPYIVQLLLTVRELLFDFVSRNVSGAGKPMSLLEAYADAAYDEDGDPVLIGALIYAGYTVITIYFGIVYIVLALLQSCMLAFLPIICVKGVSNKKVLTDWFSMYGGWMLVPCVDFIIFQIPLVFVKEEVYGVAFIATISMIQVRAFVFRKLGIEEGPAGMVAAGAMLAGISFAKKAGGAVKKAGGDIADGIKSKASNSKESKKYKELDDKGVKGASGTKDEENSKKPGDIRTLENGEKKSTSDEAVVNSGVKNTVGLNTSSVNDSEDSKDKDVSVDMQENKDENGGGSKNSQPITPEEEKKASDDIARKYINNSNFDTKENKRLQTNKEISDRYKKRGNLELAKGIGSAAAGLSGAVAGGAVGLGAATFMPAGAQGKALGAGADLVGGASGAIARGAGSLATMATSKKYGPLPSNSAATAKTTSSMPTPMPTPIPTQMSAPSGGGGFSVNPAFQNDATRDLDSYIDNYGASHGYDMTDNSGLGMARRGLSLQGIEALGNYDEQNGYQLELAWQQMQKENMLEGFDAPMLHYDNFNTIGNMRLGCYAQEANMPNPVRMDEFYAMLESAKNEQRGLTDTEKSSYTDCFQSVGAIGQSVDQYYKNEGVQNRGKIFKTI